jgi:acetyltransferase-like isoleucine patch superfamily enzyme
VEDAVYIGDDCLISCSDSILIGRGTLLGHGVQIFDNNSHPVGSAARLADWRAIAEGANRAAAPIAHGPVAIGSSVWLGFHSIVLKGVTIGDGAIVAAGSIVTTDVEPDAVVAGAPATVVRRLAGGETAFP